MLKPELIHLVEEVPGRRGRRQPRDPRRAAQRRDRAPAARRRRAAVPRPRSHRGEGPRRHQVMVDRGTQPQAWSASPMSSGGRSSKARILLEDAGPASASSRCIARATRIATPCSSSGRRAARWSTRAPRSRSGSRGAATSSTCRRSIAAATRSAATSFATLCFVFEHMFDSIEQNLTDGWRFYDPHVAPPEFLDVAVASGRRSRSISTGPRRSGARSSKRAVDLYRIRGTQARPDAVPEAVHRPRARHQRERRGRSRASASRARAPKKALASRSTRSSCRRSIWRTASS